MPRMKTIKPALQQEIEKDIRAQCGSFLSKEDFIEYTHWGKTKAAAWLEGLPFVVTTGKRGQKRKNYYASAIAEKMYLNTEV